MLSRMTDEDLRLPLRHYLPSAPADDARQAIDLIHDNTAEHFFEHRGWIRDFASAAPFVPFDVPGLGLAWVPSDLTLRVPTTSSLDRDRLHFLIYIPWDEKYLANVDEAYRDFFLAVLPYLHARTTDVHVATCLPFARELIEASPEEVDARVVYVAFILHDSGWSQMSEAEIAASLGVQGLALSGDAVSPKLRHVELGRALAERVLTDYPFTPPLTAPQRETVYQAILFHDKPQDLATGGGVPPAVRVVCNVDHLWSFTHENFWQDTVRKGVEPESYLENLGRDLDAYFVGEPGKRRARMMLEDRRGEVAAWKEWVRHH
jgi:ribosomal protein S18 acetylase RimI-like enzyme